MVQIPVSLVVLRIHRTMFQTVVMFQSHSLNVPRIFLRRQRFNTSLRCAHPSFVLQAQLCLLPPNQIDADARVFRRRRVRVIKTIILRVRPRQVHDTTAITDDGLHVEEDGVMDHHHPRLHPLTCIVIASQGDQTLQGHLERFKLARQTDRLYGLRKRHELHLLRSPGLIGEHTGGYREVLVEVVGDPEEEVEIKIPSPLVEFEDVVSCGIVILHVACFRRVVCVLLRRPALLRRTLNLLYGLMNSTPTKERHILRGLQATYASLCTPEELSELLTAAADFLSTKASIDSNKGSETDEDLQGPRPFPTLLSMMVQRQLDRIQHSSEDSSQTEDWATLAAMWPMLAFMADQSKASLSYALHQTPDLALEPTIMAENYM